MALTLYEKIFNRHVVREDNDTYLIYIDRHLVHEVTSPQAFEGLRMLIEKYGEQILYWLFLTIMFLLLIVKKESLTHL